MLRLHGVRLPLGHDEAALRAAVLRRLGIGEDALLGWRIARRGHDARRRGAVALTYTLDVSVTDEAALQTRLPDLARTPETGYRPPLRAPARLRHRPLVIGAGPCGIFAALMLARMGFRPIILERGQAVRQRTRDTFRFWR
jgi:uncharacterized FAD-dependent dehydrogenase